MLETFTPMQVKTNDGGSIHLQKKGNGYPLLLLHGYPETHVTWHKIAPRLAETFTVVLADLRGYGDSSKPKGKSDHSNYSKRVMAQDMVDVMRQLGYNEFYVAGHDRGARVTHRLVLDHPDRIKKVAVLAIAPTYKMYMTTDKAFATSYFHWFFLIQPLDFPEHMIEAQPEYFLRNHLERESADPKVFSPEAVDEYVRCFRDPASIHGSCEDYRASTDIDLRDDEADMHQKVRCPLLALWGSKSFVGKHYDVLATWCERAENVQGYALPAGHYLPEEVPEETYQALHTFFLGS